MYTNIYFPSFKYKFIWKEKYLNFVIKYNFNDDSVEKMNSITWFINEKYNNKYINKFHILNLHLILKIILYNFSFDIS